MNHRPTNSSRGYLTAQSVSGIPCSCVQNVGVTVEHVSQSQYPNIKFNDSTKEEHVISV